MTPDRSAEPGTDGPAQTCKDGFTMMMSPRTQKTVVSVLVVVIGLAMVLALIGRGG